MIAPATAPSGTAAVIKPSATGEMVELLSDKRQRSGDHTLIEAKQEPEKGSEHDEAPKHYTSPPAAANPAAFFSDLTKETPFRSSGCRSRVRNNAKRPLTSVASGLIARRRPCWCQAAICMSPDIRCLTAAS